MKRLLLIVIGVAIALFSPSESYAYATKEAIPEIRIGKHKGYTRFVIESSSDPKFQLLLNESTSKIFLVSNDISWKYLKIKEITSGFSPIDNVEYFTTQSGGRVEIMLKPDVSIIQSTTLSKDSNNGYRYIVDFTNPINTKIETIGELVSIIDKANFDNPDPQVSDIVINTLGVNENKDKKNVTNAKKQKTKPIIMIDAGHGGEDPGAIGRGLLKNIKEKDITLDYALLLYAKLQKTGKYSVKLTRTGDYFVGLADRREKAKKTKSDLFISLHIDSNAVSNASGLSVYTLSEQSSDEMTKNLARSHNSDSIINGVTFDDKDKLVSSLMIDLSRRRSTNDSAKFAEIIIRNAKHHHVNVLYNTHRFAGFAVLKGPDIPSVLVEIGYISNKSDIKKLSNPRYMSTVTSSMIKSIDEFFGT